MTKDLLFTILNEGNIVIFGTGANKVGEIFTLNKGLKEGFKVFDYLKHSSKFYDTSKANEIKELNAYLDNILNNDTVVTVIL